MNLRAEKRKELIQQAKATIDTGDIGATEAVRFSDELKEVQEFGYAWRLLKKVGESKEVQDDPARILDFRKRIALCTYKDTHLNDEQRLKRALEILDEDDELSRSTDPETLGLAGAIHKRLWQVRRDKQELERSVEFYRRGHVADKASEYLEKQGYPGINAAFVLDLLASLDKESGSQAEATNRLIAARTDEAEQIRSQIIDGLQPLLRDKKDTSAQGDYWAIVTMAEACFGLGDFKNAKEWLDVARKIEQIPSWEFESTARQLSELARLLAFDGTQTVDDYASSDAGKTLLAFLGDSIAGLKSAYIGKVGLSLSGGGFRASLFHIGVLARLAELDQLKYVEVISCVSGGSIVGAHYYLELKNLLQNHADGDLKQKDYVDLVRRVQNGFLKGVQTNIRMRIAAEWITNMKMIFMGYSRTQRLGELYEEKLYSEIKDGGESAPRYMTDLLIVPKDNEAEKRFNPRRQNWSRANKVPILILNATTLNTGHNWQFTASWMGEPPTTVNPKIDANYRLRRMYYDDAPDNFRKVRVGTAVGASSCVPGLFEPVALENLYVHPREGGEDEKITVRLVDGGVHDNQGVVGLIEQDCDVMLVSDASGQMEADDNPSNGLLAVPLRSNSILMSRVRNAEYDDLMSRKRSTELRDLMFIHLKEDLRSDPVNWAGSIEPTQSAAAVASENDQRQQASDTETYYDMNRRVQRLLAGNRTDLDAWNNAEAYTLMLSAYRMAKYSLDNSVTTLPRPNDKPEDPVWEFMQADELQKKADEKSLYMRILAVGSKTALKVWHLCKPLQVTGAAICIAVLGLLIYFGWRNLDYPLLTVESVGLFVLGIVVATFLGKVVMQVVWFRQTLAKIVFGVVMSVFGFLVARLHLIFFNPLYLRLGEIDRLLAAQRRPESGS